MVKDFCLVIVRIVSEAVGSVLQRQVTTTAVAMEKSRNFSSLGVFHVPHFFMRVKFHLSDPGRMVRLMLDKNNSASLRITNFKLHYLDSRNLLDIIRGKPKIT